MLVEALGYQAESSVTPTLKIMERDGLIEIHGGGRQRAYRFLSLTSKARQMLGVGGLPILGRIPAGPLQEALTEPEGFLESSSLLPHRPGDFLLRVTGDSMTGDGIRDGDLVLLRPGEEVRKGEIAAAYIGRGAATPPAAKALRYRDVAKHRRFREFTLRSALPSKAREGCVCHSAWGVPFGACRCEPVSNFLHPWICATFREGRELRGVREVPNGFDCHGMRRCNRAKQGKEECKKLHGENAGRGCHLWRD